MIELLIFLLVLIAILVLSIMADLIEYIQDSLEILLCFGSKKHVPDYEGIVENTIFGQKDIFCPKCKNTHCMYVYVCGEKIMSPFEVFGRKRKLRDAFKYSAKDLFKEYIEKSNIVEKYKCNNCGYIFK